MRQKSLRKGGSQDGLGPGDERGLPRRLATALGSYRALWAQLRNAVLGGHGTLVGRIASGTLWSGIGAVLARALGLIAAVAIARVLGRQGFGEFSAIQSTVGVFNSVAGWGMGLTATKYVSQLRRDDPSRAGRIIALSWLVTLVSGCVVAAILALLAPFVAGTVLGASHLIGPLRVGTMSLLLSGLVGAQLGALAGFEAFRTIAVVGVVSGFVTLPMTVGLAMNFGVPGAVWGMTLSFFVNWVIGHLAVRHEMVKCGVSVSFRGCSLERKILFGFSVPSVVVAVLPMVAAWSATAMLANQPHGFAEVGLYNAANRIKQVPELLLGFFLGPLLPVLCERRAAGESHAFQKALALAVLVSVLLVVPISLLQVAVPRLTLLPYGHQFQGELDVVRWLMLSAVTVGLLAPLGSVLVSAGKMWLNAGFNVVWAVLYVALAYVAVPRYGAAGFAGAAAGSYLLPGLLLQWHIFRREAPRLGKAMGVLIVSTFVALFFCWAAGELLAWWAAGLVAVVACSVLAVVLGEAIRWALREPEASPAGIAGTQAL